MTAELRRNWLRPALCGFIILLAGCTTYSDLDGVLAETGAMTATPAKFTVCYGHGCQKRVGVAFSEADWALVAAAFEPPPADAEEERRALRESIATFETLVGEKAGTAGDVGGSFTGLGKPRQLDCVDEMMNTTTYVQLMINEGLVMRHEVGQRLTNTFFSNGNVWPHTAMTIREVATGREWAIDSWWLKNGARPYIVSAEDWANSTWQQPRSAGAKEQAERRQAHAGG